MNETEIDCIPHLEDKSSIFLYSVMIFLADSINFSPFSVNLMPLGVLKKITKPNSRSHLFTILFNDGCEMNSFCEARLIEPH